MADFTNLPIVAIIGAGGIGIAAARRLGNGKLVVLADFNASGLEAAASQLRVEAYNVETLKVDISSLSSVTSLTTHLASRGRLETVVHTAAASPPNAPPDVIYHVNLLGTAHVIEAFKTIMSPGSSMVCFSSSAAHFGQLIPPEQEQHFCHASPDKLMDSPAINLESDDNGKAYRLSKKANILRVQASAAAYGALGARINIVTPGVVATPMGQAVLDGPNGERTKTLIAASPIKRIATPGDIADAVSFLAGSGASYITGTELIVDGGASAGFLRTPRS